MCKNATKHEETAQEIKRLLESRFGKFSAEDFCESAKLLGFELLPWKVRSTFNDYYNSLSDEERVDMDFMMHM